MAADLAAGVSELPLPDSQATNVLVDNLLMSSQVDQYHAGADYQDLRHPVLLTGSEIDLPASQLGFMGASTSGAVATASMYPAQLALPDASTYAMGGMGGNMFMHTSNVYPLEAPGTYTAAQKHISLQKPEHEDSRAKRRGPMDEMRQLVRIMVKFLPQSVDNLSTSDEPGGGNRVTEPQIKAYLRATLGDEAPQPTWGMPNGWGAYLSDLFSWALKRPVTDDEARSCACRQQGRSWQVKETRLAELGIFAYAWPLPLTQNGVLEAQRNPGNPPPGSNFIGPPPGWPYVELPMSVVGRATPGAKARARGPAEDHSPQARLVRTIPSRLAAPPVSADKPEASVTELECLRDALQLIQAASKMRPVQSEAGVDPSDQLLSIVDKIQETLAATYGTVQGTSGAVQATTATEAVSDTPKVRAARQLLETYINSPSKQPVAIQAQAQSGTPPRVAVQAQSRGQVGAKLVPKLTSSQPTMDDLVSAAMTHCKANGEVITPTETEDRTTTSDQHVANGRKRRKAAEAGEGWMEEAEAAGGEAQSGRLKGPRQKRIPRGKTGMETAFASVRGSHVTASDEDRQAWGPASCGGVPGQCQTDSQPAGEADDTGNATATAAQGPTAAQNTEVSRLRSTIYEQMIGGLAQSKAEASSRPESAPASLSAGGFAVAGDDMLPLGSLPVSSRQRNGSSSYGLAQTVGSPRRGRH